MVSRLNETPAVGNGWKDRAICRPEVFTGDPNIFYPPRLRTSDGNGSAQHNEDRAEMIAKAKDVCVVCPVRRECLEYAMDIGETEGIWGGTAPEERGMRELR